MVIQMNYDDSLGNDADDDALPGGDMRRELHESADRERLLELELENAGLRRQLAGLEAARANYLDFYELAPVGFLTIDARGAILQANVRAAKLLGASMGDLISQPVANFVFESDREPFARYCRSIFRTAAAPAYELRMRQVSGGRVWVLVEAGAVQDAAGQLVLRTYP